MEKLKIPAPVEKKKDKTFSSPNSSCLICSALSMVESAQSASRTVILLLNTAYCSFSGNFWKYLDLASGGYRKTG